MWLELCMYLCIQTFAGGESLKTLPVTYQIQSHRAFHQSMLFSIVLGLHLVTLYRRNPGKFCCCKQVQCIEFHSVIEKIGVR
jgi:hypothetical protein